jgi:hypothetical protein
MPTFGDGRIYPDPKTPSQLRAALGAAQTQADAAADGISDLDSQVGPVTATFTSTGALGQPVYVTAADTVDLADADAAATSQVVGLVSTAASAGNSGEYISGGRITQADWTTATGGALLTPGSVYCLSATTGRLTTTPPSSIGQFVVRCGRALNTTTLLVAIEPGVKL